MSQWAIGLNPPPGGRGYWIADAMNAQLAWKRLSRSARAAVGAAYPDRPIRAHHQTRDSLTRHGFAAWDNDAQDWLLTDAGKAVAKWCIK